MRGYNVIAVFSHDKSRMLMCRRVKDPYAGQLIKEVSVAGDENPLFWSGLEHDFFDMTRYAGEGNIGHIMEHIRMNRDRIFREDDTPAKAD